MDPLPNADDTVAFFEGVSPSTGAWIKIKNPNYTPGATCQFPDVAPTDAGGEHNVMIDMKLPLDNTEVSPYIGNFYFILKRLDNIADSTKQEIDYWDSGYLGHISNLSFENTPQHGDSLIAIVEKLYSGQKWRDSLIVEMDTTEYWSAFVVPNISLDPEDSVVTGIKENQKPTRFTLSAWPNPFNSAVTISVDCHSRENGNPEIEIFDINGRIVYEMPVGARPASPAGNAGVAPTVHEFIWQPDESIGSGVYLVRAKSGDKTVTKPIIYLK
jgi:hypothetical protein